VKKSALAGVVLGAVVLALSGCSSSSDQSAPTSTGPAKVAPPAILHADTLKICAPNDGTPPSVYHDETGALVGSEVDLGKAIAKKLGLAKIEWYYLSSFPKSYAPGPKPYDMYFGQETITPERENDGSVDRHLPRADRTAGRIRRQVSQAAWLR